ncbi:MBL fold metallo-hydrolase [bacterium]|nr:MBL fold metallo-hydrolase [bacterium]
MKNRFWLIAVITLVLLIICISELPNPSNVQFSFLNIGQGDSIYIHTPDDYSILIDGGPDMSVLEQLAQVMPRYNRTINMILLTHPHSDHVNGLVEVLKRFEVKKVMVTGTPCSNAYYQKFFKLCNEQNIPIYFGEADKDVKVGRFLYLDIVWPIKKMVGKKFENLNNASLSVRAITPSKVVMLSGDAEIEEESEMVASGFDLSADILKAGHHGSKTSSSNAFLNAVSPDIAVIQCGKDNSFGHPHKETLEKYLKRSIRVRRNDLEGRIDLIFN